MVRKMVQLSEFQAAKLKERARKEGVSMSELVRRSVDKMLNIEPPSEEVRKRAHITPGMLGYGSGASDVSVNHDKYLAEILARDHTH